MATKQRVSLRDEILEVEDSHNDLKEEEYVMVDLAPLGAIESFHYFANEMGDDIDALPDSCSRIADRLRENLDTLKGTFSLMYDKFRDYPPLNIGDLVYRVEKETFTLVALRVIKIIFSENGLHIHCACGAKTLILPSKELGITVFLDSAEALQVFSSLARRTLSESGKKIKDPKGIPFKGR